MSRQDRSRSVTELHIIKSWSSGGLDGSAFLQNGADFTGAQPLRCYRTEGAVQFSQRLHDAT